MCPEPVKRGFLGAYSSTAELTNSRKQCQEEKNEKANRFDHPFFSGLLIKRTEPLAACRGMVRA